MELTDKYRPKALQDVVGQGPTTKSIAALLTKNQHLPPCMLFSGPSGVGKTTIARICAAMVGCSPNNIIEIDAASHTGVDDMREITSRMNYSPMGSKSRVVIVDEAQRLSRNAFDSLLKSLEEPPEHTSWVLCTTEPSKIPKNIETRTTHYKLNTVSAVDLTTMLNSIIVKEELKGVDKRIIALAASKAGGSPRQALKYLGMVADCLSFEEAKELIKSSDASDIPAAILLARALVGRKGWKEVVPILRDLEGVECESVRIIVVNYLNKCIIGSEDERDAREFVRMLNFFLKPLNPSDKLGPIILAVASITMS